jgi:KipI family sensor histidine kinase inhibitor
VGSGNAKAVAGKVFAYGDDLVAVALQDTRTSQALADHLRDTGQWIECVAGISSCVAQFDNATVGLDEARERLESAIGRVRITDDEEAVLVEIPICYGGECGPDLTDICEQIGMSPDQFIETHAGREYRIDMLGFTPGFAFIGGLDEVLNVPRRSEPRVRVESGSIGIAGGRTGIYTLAGPGGWPLVGRTPAKLFDAGAADPFCLRAGMRVRFVPISQGEFDTKVAR